MRHSGSGKSDQIPDVRKHSLEDFHLNFVDSLEDISMAEQQVLLHMPIVLPEESLPNCDLERKLLTPDSQPRACCFDPLPCLVD